MSRNSHRPSAANVSEEDFNGSNAIDSATVAVISPDQPLSATQKWADRWVSRLRSDAAKSSYSAGSSLSRR